MSQVIETAREVATERAENDFIVLPRQTVNTQVKERGEFETISHEEIQEGFTDAGWEYERHLYFRPEQVHQRSIQIAQEFRASGQLLATHEEICDAVAESVNRGVESGWEKGRFVETIRDAFTELGWQIDVLNSTSRSRTVYFFPLYELFVEHHPNGWSPYSTSDPFTYYVSQSIEQAIDSQ